MKAPSSIIYESISDKISDGLTASPVVSPEAIEVFVVSQSADVAEDQAAFNDDTIKKAVVSIVYLLIFMNLFFYCYNNAKIKIRYS